MSFMRTTAGNLYCDGCIIDGANTGCDISYCIDAADDQDHKTGDSRADE